MFETFIATKTNKAYENLKPFIRWAGGKQNLIKNIIPHLPSIGFNNRYFEPFLGAGSVFLTGYFENAFLSDINAELINCYQCIKDTPLEVYDNLTTLSSNFSSIKYYNIRNDYNLSLGKNDQLQAARFIILVQSSFNGIFRVNRNGHYNVPFGKIKPSLPSKELLLTISNKLQYVQLECSAYNLIADIVKNGDFVYLDPPYPPLNKTSAFQHYTIEKFPLAEQERVASFALKLNETGAKVMISNADTDEIRTLYSGWDIFELETTRYVSCKSTRHKVKELLIKNF